MLIDWFTVAAQVLNFLILVWLMKRFLYKPVLDAIDAREKRIAAELAGAKAKQTEASAQRDALQKRNDTFDQQRAKLLEKATGEAAHERQRLINEAHAEADALLASRRKKLRSDAASLNRAIQQKTRQEVFAIARKTLAELASASMEASATTEFIRRLKSLEPADKSLIVNALEGASEPALIRSAFELPDAQRTAIQDAVNELFASEQPLHFDTADALMGGIELSVNGQRVAWSIDAYLGSLEADVVQLLDDAKAPASDDPASTAEPT